MAQFECWALGEPDQFDPEYRGVDPDARHDDSWDD